MMKRNMLESIPKRLNSSADRSPHNIRAIEENIQ
jgi:hypothetical protein